MYFGTQIVVRRLREMTDGELAVTYAQGLHERLTDGPVDGDAARSTHLFELVSAEVDARLERVR